MMVDVVVQRRLADRQTARPWLPTATDRASIT